MRPTPQVISLACRHRDRRRVRLLAASDGVRAASAAVGGMSSTDRLWAARDREHPLAIAWDRLRGQLTDPALVADLATNVIVHAPATHADTDAGVVVVHNLGNILPVIDHASACWLDDLLHLWSSPGPHHVHQAEGQWWAGHLHGRRIPLHPGTFPTLATAA